MSSKKSLFRIATVGTALAVTLAMAGCTAPKAAGSEEFSGVVPVYTPRQGGSAYVLGGGIANEMSKTIDQVQGGVEATTGTQEMIQRLTDQQEAGEVAFALPDTTGTAYAIEGRSPFTEKYPDLRAMATVQQAVIYLVAREDSDMDSIDDLKGKSIGLGVSGSVVNYLTKEILEAHGVAEGDYSEQPLGYQEVADGLANNSVDAGVIAGAAPVSALTELAAQHDVTVLKTNADVMAELTETSPYVLDDAIEPGMYQGMDEEIPTFGFSVAMVTHKDAPDEAVTKMMDLLFTRQKELAQVHASAKGITFDNATNGISFEFHPAAKKYLEENGVVVP